MARQIRIWQVTLILGIVMAVVGSIGMAVTGRQAPDSRPYQTLDEAIELKVASGWQLVQPPILPGPFRWAGSPYQVSKGQGGPVSWHNKVSEVAHRFAPEPNIEQMAFPLEAADGQLTFAVLIHK